MIQLSVIVVSYNAKAVLLECLRSIQPLITDASVETIVIDNNSADDTVQSIKLSFPRVKVFQNSQNVGFGTANNQGMKSAQGKYFLLLNSDTIAARAEIDKCVQFIENNPQCGMVGCKLKFPDGRFQPSGGYRFTFLNAFWGGMEVNTLLEKIPGCPLRIPSYLLTEKEAMGVREVDWIVGAFMLLRREVYANTGGFDENIFLYDEEYEWCYRIKKAGYKIFYFPPAEIVHIGGASGASLGDLNRNILILQGKEYFFKKHAGKLSALYYKLLVFSAAVLKVPLLFLLSWLLPNSRRLKNRLFFQYSTIVYFLRG
ncbi:MAG: glycosyltransferase family 2 protein [Candidatus Omnitrophica bacterium]|nr:glycosyltransferase family 2 protein [Candidatus Omnitrophota bacterium]